MSRSLPLGTTDALPAVEPHDEPTLSGTVAVYDPAMCCPTGVCGPGVDPALIQVARDLRWLSAHGATVERFGLSQEPQAFVSNTRVTGLMQAFGDNALPAVLVNGAVLAHGRYTTRDELVAALSAATEHATVAPTTPLSAKRPMMVLGEADGSSCAPGSGCC